MNFTNLRQNHEKLLRYLNDEGYAKDYIRLVKYDIHWILKNEKGNSWHTYVDIYNDKVSESNSKSCKKAQRHAFGAIQQFDLYGEYPNRRIKNSLIKRANYYKLIPEFKELIDYYQKSDKTSDLEDTTIKGTAFAASCFLYTMQKRGLKSLDSIEEADALSYFLNGNGRLMCSEHKRRIAAVFKVGIAWKENECRRILAYLPRIRPKRKNIQFLTPEEVEAIRKSLDNESCALSFRDRAIGKLLFFTGIRACDIAAMKCSSINWQKEEICLSQLKTGAPLILPLTAAIGNSIFDYIANERPESSGQHLFLGELYPHYPIMAGAIWHISIKIYKAAAVRQNAGDRRGSHLFRHNVATSFLGNGVPRPVASNILGHNDPVSINPYMHADFVHLKKCALSIEAFPVRKGVFNL